MTTALAALLAAQCTALVVLFIALTSALRRLHAAARRTVLLTNFVLRVIESGGGDAMSETELARVHADLLATCGMDEAEWRRTTKPGQRTS